MASELSQPWSESQIHEQEQVYERLRQSGEEAPAKILSVMGMEVRTEADCSWLELYVEVYPDELPPFNAVTQFAVPDEQRGKFEAGRTIFVKFDPENPKEVAVERKPY